MVKKQIPKKMKAAVLHDVFPPMGKTELEEVDVPEPGEYEILMKVKAAGVGGTDPKIMRGDFKGLWPPSFPIILGHEWAGDVVKRGPHVDEFKVGDRVAGESHKGCGVCTRCIEGRYTICQNYGRVEKGHRHYGFTVDGAFAEYMAVSVKSIHKIPPKISYDEAVMVDTASCALYGVESAGIEIGDDVAILGSGGIGLSAAGCAKAMGAGRVFVVGRRWLDLPKKFGADYVINAKKGDPVKKIMQLTDGKGVEVAVECAGSTATVEQSIKVLARGGRVAIIGLHAKPSVPINTDRIVLDDIKLVGTRANPNRTAKKIIDLMARDKLNFKPLITHKFPLDKFNQAIETQIKRLSGCMKVVINP